MAGKNRRFAVAVAIIALLIAPNLSAPEPENNRLKSCNTQSKTWRAIHLTGPSHENLNTTKQLIAEVLAPMQINVLILEVNYSFQFTSHPELASEKGLTANDARQLTELSRKHGIRLIPLFNCLGHQSWAKNTFALLEKYPQFDETPHIPKDNNDIYCREWCPSHPEVNKIIFDLMDELIDAFDADALHVGMDEVFLIGDEKCPRCKGKDTGELFAKAVNDYHKHLVTERKVEMLIWGDRLLDSDATGYGTWEASKTGSHRAVDLVPKDIIICDWHYEPMPDYPSVRFFQQKGFRVLPATWKNPDAAIALLKCARKDATEKMLGILFTNWSGGRGQQQLLAALKDSKDTKEPPDISDTTKGVADAMKLCLEELNKTPQKPEKQPTK
jgi:hypothetical protein